MASAPTAAIGAATVIGCGPTGLAQAALLLKRANDVGLKTLTVVEKRPAYTRPVGLFFRTLTLDALRWLDDETFAALEQGAGLRDEHGQPHRFASARLEDGQWVRTGTEPRPDADADRFARDALDKRIPLADVADAMFSENSLAIITMRDLETALWNALPRLARQAGVTLQVQREVEAEAHLNDDGSVGVTLHPLVEDVTPGGGRRRVRSGASTRLPPQGLILDTEGSGARVRSAVIAGLTESGEPSPLLRTGPTERYLVAALNGPKNGVSRNVGATSVHIDDDGVAHKVRVAQGMHGHNGLGWTTVSVPDVVQFDSSSPDAHQQSIEAYFRTHAGLVCDPSLQRDSGPGIAPISGTLVSKAVLSPNFVLAGDAVGTSHFKAAGGAATGITTHLAAMHRFLDDVAADVRSGSPRRAQSLQQLDDDLRVASLTWALHGLPEYSGDPWVLRERYLPRDLIASLCPPHLVERYWPVDGGAPTDPRSPWQAWFADAAPPRLGSDAEVKAVVDGLKQHHCPVEGQTLTAAAWSALLAGGADAADGSATPAP